MIVWRWYLSGVYHNSDYQLSKRSVWISTQSSVINASLSFSNSYQSLPYSSIAADSVWEWEWSACVSSWMYLREEWSPTEKLKVELPMEFEQSSDSPLQRLQLPFIPSLYHTSQPECLQKARQAGLWGTRSFRWTTLKKWATLESTYFAQSPSPTLGCPKVQTFTALPLCCSLNLTAAMMATAPPKLCPVKSSPKPGCSFTATAMAFSSPLSVSLRQEVRKPAWSSHFLQRCLSQSILRILASVRKFLMFCEPLKTTTIELMEVSMPMTASMLLPRICLSTLKPGQQSGHWLLRWWSLVMLQMAEERWMDLLASAGSQLASAAARTSSRRRGRYLMGYNVVSKLFGGSSQDTGQQYEENDINKDHHQKGYSSFYCLQLLLWLL